MALITMPTGGIESIDWTLPEAATFVVRNQWTGGQTVADLGGIRAAFKAKVTLAPGKLSRAPWGAFYSRLRGPANTFRLPAVGQKDSPIVSATMLGNGQRANLLLQSSGFAGASWTKSNATITGGYTFSPEGVAGAASAFTNNSATSTHYIAIGATYVAFRRHTFSAYFLSTGPAWVHLGTALDGDAWFNINAGTVGTITGTNTTAAITPAGFGYYRCSITFDATTAGNYVYIYSASGDGVSTFAGGGTLAFIVWGAQLEPGPIASTYLPTTTATATGRDGFLIGGLTPNVTYLRTGQLVTFANRLFVVTNDVLSAGGSVANVGVSPDLPTLPTGAETAVLYQPYAEMRMTTPALGWSDGLANIYTPFAFTCEEVL
jgi:hypothetical protein